MNLRTPSNAVIQTALELLLADVQAQSPNDDDKYPSESQSFYHPMMSRELDKKLESLLVVSQAFTTELAVRTATLRSQRNNLAPIHRLPVELLSKIFRWATGLDGLSTPPNFFRAVRNLAQVSRAWSLIIKGYPRLWAVIDARQSEASWMTSLRLSQTHPLVVRFESYSMFSPSLWTAVTQNLHRWDSAHIELPSSDDLTVLSALQTTSAPTLKELHIFSLYRHPVLDLFGGSAPNLIDLVLYGVALRDWTSPILRGLRILHLTWILSDGPTLQQMFHVLTACPNLEELRFAKINFTEEDEDTPTTFQAITLPTLRSLDLSDLSQTNITQLLSVIRSPNCNIYSISSDPPPDPATPFMIAIASHVASSFRSRLTSASQSHVYVHSTDNRLLMTSDLPSESTPSFRLSLRGRSTAPDVLECLTHLVDPTQLLQLPSPPIEIQFHESRTLIETLPILWRLPGITKLSFEFCYRGMDEAIEALSSPKTLEDGTRVWLCPQLDIISFRHCNYSGGQQLLQMVEARAKAHTEGEGPRGLSTLVVERGSSMDKGTFRAIKRVLGEGATWDGEDAAEGESDNTGEVTMGNGDGDVDLGQVATPMQ